MLEGEQQLSEAQAETQHKIEETQYYTWEEAAEAISAWQEEERPLLEKAKTEFKITVEGKEVGSAYGAALTLLKKYSTLKLTIPINDGLSPFTKDSEFWSFTPIYECVVAGYTVSTVTLIMHNRNNLKGVLNTRSIEKPQMYSMPVCGSQKQVRRI